MRSTIEEISVFGNFNYVMRLHIMCATDTATCECLTHHIVSGTLTYQLNLTFKSIVDSEQYRLDIKCDPLTLEILAQLSAEGKVLRCTYLNSTYLVNQPYFIGNL